MPSRPSRQTEKWDTSDLIRRVVLASETAQSAICNIARLVLSATPHTGPQSANHGFMQEKVVAETAMLLLCMERIQSLDGRIRTALDLLARLLIPHARHPDVLAAICLDPGLARDHAMAHIILTRLGYPDPQVDELLLLALTGTPGLGPERLPHRTLEQDWLSHLWNRPEAQIPTSRQVLGSSALGRPLDALGAARFDLYTFTHAVMYASDLGARRFPLPRSAHAIAADAEAGLAYSLDVNDYDLTVELLMTWPMLCLPWSGPAVFAFHILADTHDRLGFLPGITCDLAACRSFAGQERSDYMLRTSYHTLYVMGFLCAAALLEGRTPPRAIRPSRRKPGVAAALISSFYSGARDATPCWVDAFASLAPEQQDSLAGLLLAIVLRRARARGDLRLSREALHFALVHDLVEGPAVAQTAALLRRASLLRL